MKKKIPTPNLRDVKTILEIAEKGLAGVGFGGVEPIAGIPLLIIGYYEVSFCHERSRLSTDELILPLHSGASGQ